MITQLDLQTFKCFKELNLPVAPLTLLSGGNASGKSTILQSLVLLNQTMREHEWSNRLYLNGNAMALGSVQDVVDKINARDTLGIAVHGPSESYHWQFRDERESMSMLVESVSVSGQPITVDGPMRYLLPHQPARAQSPALIQTLRRMTYLTAERVGPRELYPLVEIEDYVNVGTTGEFTAGTLYQLRDAEVLPQLRRDTINTVLHQAELWMQEFFPNCGLRVDRVEKRNYVTLGLRTAPDTDYHRPNNVGFGLTQVLPIIVAVLTAARGDVLLIENPEVHLHPAGQALMGMFLARAASAGIQIILETHSDHVLNGMRRAVKSEIVTPENVFLYFFNARYSLNDTTAQVMNPLLDRHGNVDRWPAGFFDQFDRDADYFAGWGE